MVRLLEVLSSLVILTAFVALGLRTQHEGTLQVPGVGHLPVTLVLVGLGTVLLGVTLIIWHRIRTGRRSRWTTVLLFLPPLLLLTATSWQTGKATWHRIRSDDGARDYFYRQHSLAERDAHAFALRLLAAGLPIHLDHGATARPLPVVGTWPVPGRFQFHVAPLSRTTAHLFSRRNGLVCRITLSDDWRLMASQYGFACVESGYAPPGPWSALELIQPATTPFQPEPEAATAWPQYRRNAARTGGVTSNGRDTPSPFWYASIQGQARATPSVVGDVVLIGTHGNGVLEARDRRTGRLRWREREPNWIHQDAVSDGRIAYVGFGDNGRSFKGAAPSGVAAHDLKTGERRWVRFADNSVMTSPVLWQHLVVFGDASGTVEAVNTMDGTMAWKHQLPGNHIMGPPAVGGDTVFIPLDPRGLCALDVKTGNRHWCIKLPTEAARVGHVAPTLTGTQVTGSATIHVEDSGELLFAFRLRAPPLLWSWWTTGTNPVAPRQAVYSVSRASGRLTWWQELDGGRCCGSGRSGHMSGTPVIVPKDSSLVVVSPYADRVYRLDEETGEILARSEPIPVFPRGPALVVDSTVIAVDRQGVIHVLAVDDLHEHCAIPLGEPVDRTGPTLAEGALLIAGGDGGLYSIPLDDVLRCDPTLSDRIARLREATATGG